MSHSEPILLNSIQKRTLGRWLRQGKDRLQKRSKILLLAGTGETNIAIANCLNVSRNTVSAIRRRFAREGLPSIERISSGRKPELYNSLAPIIMQKTNLVFSEGGPSLSGRSLARELQISRSMVYRVWKNAGIQPACRRNWRDDKFHRGRKSQNTEARSGLVLKDIPCVRSGEFWNRRVDRTRMGSAPCAFPMVSAVERHSDQVNTRFDLVKANGADRVEARTTGGGEIGRAHV